MAHCTYLVIFHLKVIICENFNLPHIYGHHLKKKTICDMIIIKLFTLLPNLFKSYGITMFHRCYKFPNLFKSYGITMFHRCYKILKDKKSFQSFLEYICFINTLWRIYFWHKYTLTSHHIKNFKCSFLAFDFFRFWPIIICKNIFKILHNNGHVLINDFVCQVHVVSM